MLPVSCIVCLYSDIVIVIRLLYSDGYWGSVCVPRGSDWTKQISQVICRQLHDTDGYSTNNDFGRNNGPVWMDDVRCDGNESTLEECRFRPWGVTHEDCRDHNLDLSVVCKSKLQSVLSLVCYPVSSQHSSFSRLEPVLPTPSYIHSFLHDTLYLLDLLPRRE